MNLRDKEVDQTGGIQKGVVDLWEHLGSKPECRYTWDASRNSNIEVSVLTEFMSSWKILGLIFRFLVEDDGPSAASTAFTSAKLKTTQ